ncbi:MULTISPECIES: LacI family DNA-binding transcriptional regulator [unclassified Leifsonia]|uniref:LacI family DNA-binding transcriptional regulator n=1 Tax=unclassified Leifsonia TaxID=2663824 RepID=UPI0008A7B4AA|nr:MULTISPECIES: LacI family DNA-binding transcriptional regulator [unclassified Leifsonia]SEI14065.1 DNA-binding transcriptional regulator, LacI/PurR family [Leifsonia sp. CL154]SFM01410.1 DNA-binding transcriptional regulator, LacI/PurR family [Leifsonia sp. CL147]
MKRATIYDVARHAGVSHQTVTRFLNGFEGIRPTTRAKVQAAIDELNYRPNGAARWLRSRQSNRIGILAHRMELSGPGRIIAGATTAARSRGYVLDIASMDGEDAASVDAALDVVMEHQIAGVFATAQTDVVRIAVENRGIDVPISIDSGEGLASSGANPRAHPGQLAGMHLADLGHRRVAFVNGPGMWIASGERRSGFLQVVRERGLDLVWESEGDWSAEAGYRAARELPGEVTAVALANDSMAIGLIFGLAERGIRVPDDVSVIGMDDAPESRFHLPSLSTIRLDFEGEGAYLMNVLIAKIEGEDVAEVPGYRLPELVQRASTAPVPR